MNQKEDLIERTLKEHETWTKSHPKAIGKMQNGTFIVVRLEQHILTPQDLGKWEIFVKVGDAESRYMGGRSNWSFNIMKKEFDELVRKYNLEVVTE